MRFWFFCCLFTIPYGFLFAEEPQSYCSMDRVCVEFVSNSRGVDVYFHNKIATKQTDTSISVSAVLVNMKSSKPLPLIAVLRGNRKVKLFQLKTISKKKKISYKIQYKWILGNFLSKHNFRYIYDLPFDSKLKVRVSQSYFGQKSHTGDNRYSIDFGLKEDDYILAARPGLVIDTQDKNIEGGLDPKFKESANYIKIQHDDGTIAEYAHLRYRGVLVKIGQRVTIGTVIGHSGNTGYSEGPHLHFEVYQPTKTLRKKTIPTKFRTQVSESETLSEGALLWKREMGSPIEKKIVDVDGTFICDRLDGITQEGCKQTSFSKLSPIYLLIPILRPDVYKFQLQLQKKETAIRYEYTWDSKKEDWISSFMIPIQDFQDPVDGEWVLSVWSNGILQKKIEFQLTSI
ncbi:M23 family metallopeptidase [Leptospira yanagawae]|uniref:M23 family metallopeptidase n=1 Tax=Leptospira yanagawae TaxID=293069 RepID=A0ABY2M2V0_9LEPT|nr:M23 family metallopeptidase [Leptospira yanagawae]TGL22376.1 M23 family metallopeptidase [Leptospira yanagawae]